VAIELAARAHAAGDSPQFRREALAVLGRLVPFDTAVFSEADHPDPISTIDVDRAARAVIDHCERNQARYGPDLKKAFGVAARQGGFLDHEVYSTGERRNLPLYCDVVRPQGVRFTLALLAQWRGRPLGLIRLERHGRQPFSRRALEQTAALAPLIGMALATLRHPGPAPAPLPLPRLTDREAEVARHVARGLTTPHIALILGTSPLTVRNQLCRVFDKTRVASRAELATWVAQRSLARR
jgi:DNA-binding CsgD family transcriptional regulator